MDFGWVLGGFWEAKIEIFCASGVMIFEALFLVVFQLIFYMSVMLANLKNRAPVEARAQFYNNRIFQVVS